VEIGQGSGAGPTAIPASNVVVVSPTEITATTRGSAKAGTWNLFVIDSLTSSSAGGFGPFHRSIKRTVPSSAYGGWHVEQSDADCVRVLPTTGLAPCPPRLLENQRALRYDRSQQRRSKAPSRIRPNHPRSSTLDL